MARQTGIKVIARVMCVGIAALGSVTGTQPLGAGTSSRMIGTGRDYPSYMYIHPSELYQNEGRLAEQLKALWNGGSIHIEIDGVRISKIADLMAYGEPASYLREQSDFLSPNESTIPVSGTWSSVYDDTNHRRYVRRTASAAVEVMLIELPARMFHKNGHGGVKLKSVDLVYKVSTAALADVTITAYKSSKPVNGTQLAAGAALHTNGSYDSAHDTSAERKAVNNHTLTFTFDKDTVDWLAAGENVFLVLTVDSTAISNAVFDYYGASINYYTRPSIASDSTYA